MLITRCLRGLVLPTLIVTHDYEDAATLAETVGARRVRHRRLPVGRRKPRARGSFRSREGRLASMTRWYAITLQQTG